jgi:hypothetical protein
MPKSEKLKFPIIRGKLPVGRHLSMDDYLKFITFNLRYTIDRKVVRKQKQLAAVSVPFFL